MRDDDEAVAQYTDEERLELVAQPTMSPAESPTTNEVLERLDNLDRVFRYGKNSYAYTGVFVPKTNRAGLIYLALHMQFFQRNKTPRHRQRSRRQMQKDVFAATYLGDDQAGAAQAQSNPLPQGERRERRIWRRCRAA